MRICPLHVHLASMAPASGEPTLPGRTHALPSDKTKIADSARQFEALMLHQVLNETFKPPGTGHGHPAPGSEIYQSMVTDIVTENLSQSRAFGLSTLLQSQFEPPKLAHPVSQKPAL